MRITYPPELPVSERREDIRAALSDHQVVVVAGATGSGKTTQLPKILLEMGRGAGGRRAGVIGHTQPRRLAARTVAERMASELGVEVGAEVGYVVRFTDRVGPRTRVKVMTDGILLAELARDKQLRAYDTLVIDEAHERSLNIDFILGYLKVLLPTRADLKVVITSATIDTERFSRHFGAPVVEVSGRTYPVEVRYRPPADEGDGDVDQVGAIISALDELRAAGPGDVLVFLSGEREIRDTADALRRLQLPGTEVLPLYARLAAAEQHRIFSAHDGRRIVLATNVAETSLTVPGIRYVVDPGKARISRYNQRTKVQRLPIEAISRASADQRAGRCGRVAPGICIRLYSEEDYATRPEFTEPEMLRTNLASVILQMTALGLGDMATFPFVDPPDARNVRDGIALLEELNAFEPEDPAPSRRDGPTIRRLTGIGRRLAQLPVDPRLGRMVLAAERGDCVREVLVIASALSIQDPRERPLEQRQAADELHGRFADADSDLVSWLKLWDYLQETREGLSSNQFRRRCRAEHLNYLRIREWQDVYGQLRQVATRELGLTLRHQPLQRDHVHRAVLAGLLSHVGMRQAEGRDYSGARSARFSLWPGSGLAGRPPHWVMAAELVETSRLWGREAARIQPEWAERAGAHLVRRSYGEPRWDARRGTARVDERVTLYGLPIVAGRPVDLGRIDPAGARQIFVQHALVEEDWDAAHPLLAANHDVIESVRALEDRARRRDLVSDAGLYSFYDRRLPDEVTSGRSFDSWWKRADPAERARLELTVEALIGSEGAGIDLAGYPDTWHQDGTDLDITYVFEPGSDLDGVVVEVPAADLDRVSAAGFDWQVPGRRLELVTALIRTLPKAQRRHFSPAADHAVQFLDRHGPADGPLLTVLADDLSALSGERIRAGDFSVDKLPPDLRVSFRVWGPGGRVLVSGTDLDLLTRTLRGHARVALAQKDGRPVEATWVFGTIERQVEETYAGITVRRYPALVDRGVGVSLELLDSAAAQRRAMWSGTRRLLLLSAPSSVKDVLRTLSRSAQLALTAPPHGTVTALLEDCRAAAVDRVMKGAGGAAWDAGTFAELEAEVKAGVRPVLAEVIRDAAAVLAAAHRLTARLAAITSEALAPAGHDITTQVAGLVFPGFVTFTGAARLPDVLRYLEAAGRRLDRLASSVAADRDRMARVGYLRRRYLALAEAASAGGGLSDELVAVHWMIEELRVSMWAQALGTSGPVSEQRVARALEELGG